ncbi:hypothetical protein QBC38DRAFT_458996 [Podospora fimiseda]|uniref:Uncharacterized protein n=1 Tax=Podospora fimiseda TaxID=252190 RepID=A0AAN7BI79_9PEZI|nr:hypothetical protein QBC38DRAFT_458996 [Podospora fimiseda]
MQCFGHLDVQESAAHGSPTILPYSKPLSHAIITSIIRVCYLYESKDDQVPDLRQSEFWLNIHSAAVILCSSLPVYSPLSKVAGRILAKLRDRCKSSLGALRKKTTQPRESLDSSSSVSSPASHSCWFDGDSNRQPEAQAGVVWYYPYS